MKNESQDVKEETKQRSKSKVDTSKQDAKELKQGTS
jgi:hypothetical protein